MQIRIMIPFVLAAAGLLMGGCGKKSFGAGCDKAAELTEPWSGLSLPLDEKEARVCESSADKLKVRSFDWKKKDSAAAAFEKSLTGVGYTKDKCNAQACYYKKDDHQISVQPMEFKSKKKKLVTVVLTKRASRTK